MAIKTINRLFTKDEGFSENIRCPKCERSVSLKLFSTIDTSAVALLKAEDKNLAIAVCPCCSTVFSLNKNYLKEKNSGTFVQITKEDLKIMIEAK